MKKSSLKEWFKVEVWRQSGGTLPELCDLADIREWLNETADDADLVERLDTVEDAVLAETTGLVDKVAALEAATHPPISGEPLIPVKASVHTGVDEIWEIKWEAVTAGEQGNDLSITISPGTGIESPIAVTVYKSDITVNLATNVDGSPDDTKNTATDVLGAVNTDQIAGLLIQGTLVGSGGVCAEEEKRNLKDGKDGTPGAAGQMRFGDDKVFISVGESTATTYNWKSITFDDAE